MQKINPIHLEYKNSLTPFSPLFDDIYFDSTEGIEESNFVYIDGVGLKESILSGMKKITVAEVGFGVGLNFLLTLRSFIENSKAGQELVYISAEKHPVFKEDLVELYSRFPDLKPYAQELLKRYPLLTPGFHWIKFPHLPVSLLLLLGDASEMFSKLEAKIDFWYWDGFSPAKNPEAFSDSLFQEIARISAPGARGSSFTSAGWVRRSLESVGFKVTKKQGFGRKRECITGVYSPLNELNQESKLPPWFSNQKLTHARPGIDKIGIIGAGLAGTALAQSFFKRGFAVHVIDQFGVAERASSNDVGLFNMQLSKIPNPISRFAQLSLAHFLRELVETTVPHHQGILRLEPETLACMKAAEYPEDFCESLTAAQATLKSKVLIHQEAYYFPYCGVLNPRTLCLKRIQGSKVHLNQTVQTIQRNVGVSSGHFSLLDPHGKLIIEVDHLVYATGADTPYALNELADFPMKPVRGQTIQVKPTQASQALEVTLMNKGYISPAWPDVSGNANHLIGATYQAKTLKPNQIEIDTDTLINEAKIKWTCFDDLKNENVVSIKEGYRLSTPDTLPLIGPKCDSNWMKAHYQKTLRGAAPRGDPPPPPLQVSPREWLFLAFGSRGITQSSLGAEILANLITGDVLPIELDLWEHLHCARFFVRNLKKPV